MTAPFDAAQGTGQRFTDALSGSDGTADPTATMPVLDVYPDALSAQLPDDLYPVLVPPIVAETGRPGVRAEPVLGPAAALTPAQQRIAQQRQAQQRQAQQRQAQQRQAQQRQGRQAARPAPQRAIPVAPSSTSAWQGVASSAADVAAMFRASMPGSVGQQDRQSYQATHPQSTGSGSPTGVAPAAPMASQYSGRGQSRNDAHDRSQERRRRTNVTVKKSGNGWAVLVFMVIILFATGIGQRIIVAVTELLNR